MVVVALRQQAELNARGVGQCEQAPVVGHVEVKHDAPGQSRFTPARGERKQQARGHHHQRQQAGIQINPARTGDGCAGIRADFIEAQRGDV